MTARRFIEDGRTAAASPLVQDGAPVICYSVAQVRELFFPGRCARWIREQFRTGEFGPVFFEGKSWFISADAVQGWQQKHRVCPPSLEVVR